MSYIGIYKNITGQRFGRLIALRRTGANWQGKSYWRCRCDCGNEKTIALRPLMSGDTKSCGCLAVEISKTHSRTHGDSRKLLYIMWTGMKSRCYLKNHPSYPIYGARGITICDEWRLSYWTFREWAIEKGYAVGLTIERINNNGNYEPKNCRWATRAEQNNNTRCNIRINISEETKTISQWCGVYKLPYSTAAQRRFRGWDERDLFIPKGSPRKYPLTCKNKGEHLNGPKL